MNYYISFDVGGTKVKYGILSETGEILDKGNYQTNCLDAGVFIKDMIVIIQKYKCSYMISGVAISFPGFVNSETGYVTFAGAIEAMNKTNIKQLLEEQISLPVEIENDANCAALAEKFNGNAKECEDFICMTLGTGIGGGIFVNGQIVRGHQFKGGEFGMMSTRGADVSYQNMHETSATSALIHQYKKYKGISQEQIIEGNIVFEEARCNKQVRELIDNWLKHLSYGIFNLACTLNPQKILIGGGISAQEDLIERLEEKLQEIPPWEDFKTPLESCYFKNEAGLMGALYHFLQMNKKASRKSTNNKVMIGEMEDTRNEI